MANEAKTIELGVPFGTACARLRKQVMFKLVQETGQDECHKCGLVIESVEELSIEHKEPWQGVSPDLFWDLDNIAFSHRRCNVRHSRHGTSSRYQHGCRCDECRAWKSAYAKSWRANR
jgi:hypothetical protein